MTDLRDRMRIYDQAPVPDYWNEVEMRASSGSMGTARLARSARPWLLLAAAVLLALAVGGAALALSRIVHPPNGSVTHLAYALGDDVYLADWDGTNAVRVVDSRRDGRPECSGLFAGPIWSPDGRYVAYGSQWDDACEGIVYVTDAEGRPVVSFPGAGWTVSWSPDSTRVATWIRFGDTIGIYGLDGVRQALLTVPPGCAESGDHDPRWSPDGLSVVLVACAYPVDGPTPQLLSSDDPRSHPNWVYSPDGTLVSYATYADHGTFRTASLVIADANGTELRVLTSRNDWSDPTAEQVYFDKIVWSPLGDNVAFARRLLDSSASLDTWELRVLDISSGDETTIAAEPWWGPSEYSPEGDRILISRIVDGQAMGLWSISADGSDTQLLVPGADSGDWQPLAPGS